MRLDRWILVLKMMLLAILSRYHLCSLDCFRGRACGACLFEASEMRLRIGHVFFGFGNVLVESISNAGINESCGTVKPAGETRERCRGGLGELEGRRQNGICAPSVSIGVWERKGGHTWKRLAHGRIGGLCDDIYSCLSLSLLLKESSLSVSLGLLLVKRFSPPLSVRSISL